MRRISRICAAQRSIRRTCPRGIRPSKVKKSFGSRCLAGLSTIVARLLMRWASGQPASGPSATGRLQPNEPYPEASATCPFANAGSDRRRRQEPTHSRNSTLISALRGSRRRSQETVQPLSSPGATLEGSGVKGSGFRSHIAYLGSRQSVSRREGVLEVGKLRDRCGWSLPARRRRVRLPALRCRGHRRRPPMAGAQEPDLPRLRSVR